MVTSVWEWSILQKYLSIMINLVAHRTCLPLELFAPPPLPDKKYDYTTGVNIYSSLSFMLNLNCQVL